MAYLNETGLQTLWNKIKTKAGEIASGAVSTHNDSASAHSDIRTTLASKYDASNPSGYQTSSQVSSAISSAISALGDVLEFKGTKTSESAIKAITSANKGDVWINTADGSEWLCKQNITSATASAWEKLGTTVDLTGYYTKTETDDLLDGKSPTGHTHTKSEITDFAHTHTKSQITDMPTKLSEFTNDSGFTTNTGTVTGVKVNGTTKSPTSGVVDIGTVITAHQDISGKENTSNKVVTILSTSTDTQYPSAKAVYTTLTGKQDSMSPISDSTINNLE